MSERHYELGQAGPVFSIAAQMRFKNKEDNMSSILTNNAAMVALHNLNAINKGLFRAQNEVSTGKAIANATDDASLWAISKVMESDISAFSAVSQSLNVAQATLGVALNGAESIVDVLKQINAKIVAAGQPDAMAQTIQDDIDAMVAQIRTIIGASQFNGSNLLKGTDTVSFLAALNREKNASGSASDPYYTITYSNIEITKQDLENNSTFNLDLIDITDPNKLKTSQSEIVKLMETATNSAAALGTVKMRVEIQSEFMTGLIDSMRSGVGAIQDANMEEASARLRALQVQQQLGMQTLSIANSTPETLLALFR